MSKALYAKISTFDLLTLKYNVVIVIPWNSVIIEPYPGLAPDEVNLLAPTNIIKIRNIQRSRVIM